MNFILKSISTPLPISGGFGKFIFFQSDPIYPPVFHSTRFFFILDFLKRYQQNTAKICHFAVILPYGLVCYNILRQFALEPLCIRDIGRPTDNTHTRL